MAKDHNSANVQNEYAILRESSVTQSALWGRTHARTDVDRKNKTKSNNLEWRTYISQENDALEGERFDREIVAASQRARSGSE